MPKETVQPQPTIAEHLRKSNVSRRSFLQLCSALMVTAPVGLALTEKTSVLQVAQAIGKARRPSVVWLHFQDCTGCSETLLRTSRPDVADLILNVISLDYHETLMAASGYQAEAALKQAVADNFGKFVLVVEGSVPTKEQGRYMKLAGRPALEVLKDVGSKAAAVVAIGSCASWGGIPSSGPNPTGAQGVDTILTEKPVVNIPGCPPNPYNLLAVVLEYATMKRLPALDELNRPKFAFDRNIHDHCPRRAHFDAGRFVKEFGDEGHRKIGLLAEQAIESRFGHAYERAVGQRRGGRLAARGYGSCSCLASALVPLTSTRSAARTGCGGRRPIRWPSTPRRPRPPPRRPSRRPGTHLLSIRSSL